MNKLQLHQQLMTHLQKRLNDAQKAAQRAHETATNEENIAENKYDTLALEAAYLAQGQSERVLQCQANIDLCISLPINPTSTVEIGALVVLIDNHNQPKYLLMCNVAGGTKLQWEQHTVLVVTPQSPIGSALLGQQVDDSISINVHNRTKEYDILQIL